MNKYTGFDKNLRIISYNLKYNRANRELAQLVKKYQPDVLCLQECYADKIPQSIGNLKLVKKTTLGKLNQAIYCNPIRYKALDSRSYLLKKSIYDWIFNPVDERLLVTRLLDTRSSQQILVGSFHATHIIALNHVRRNQIRASHQKLKELSRGLPAIMVGDYNYPMFRRGLKVCIEKTGYQMNLSDKPTYYATKFIRSHLDLATSLNAKVDKVLTLPRGISDHCPIMVKATF